MALHLLTFRASIGGQVVHDETVPLDVDDEHGFTGFVKGIQVNGLAGRIEVTFDPPLAASSAPMPTGSDEGWTSSS